MVATADRSAGARDEARRTDAGARDEGRRTNASARDEARRTDASAPDEWRRTNASARDEARRTDASGRGEARRTAASAVDEARRTAASAVDEARWQAVARRDGAADGTFVYAVRTTGVFCRPSCGARRARRENVSFHADAATAERAGFRACKRCRPAAARDARAALVAAACARIASACEAGEPVGGLEALAAEAGLSPAHFHRLFRARTGVTPKAYEQERRAVRVREELARGPSVTSAIHAAGYSSSGRFYERAGDELGMTPTTYRAGGAGETIQHATGACSLGHMLVAATPRGVCMIALDDDPSALRDALRDRFPRATLAAGDARFASWIAQVIAFVDDPALGLDLPLDVRGTAFQRRVWQALRALPPGTRTTYSALAETLGAPRASRAVGTACGANPVALAIPCHRVLREDGGLGGYRWGLERKAALLERERAAPARRARRPR